VSTLRLKDLAQGWRGVCLVAVTYVYFLIFAQYAFLNRLGQLGIADAHLPSVMAAMAIGGIAFSLLASRTASRPGPRLRLQLSFLLCGAAAALTLLPLNLPASIATSLLIGCALGTLTVTLVSNLGLWVGGAGALAKVGLGTGCGYFLCNVPWLFTATPETQAILAAFLCLLGIVAAWKTTPPDVSAVSERREKEAPFAFVVVGFTTLVWLDSAAFFIIQNTPALKAHTWEGTFHLWANAFIHFSAALAGASLLRRRGLSAVLGLAVLALALACLLLHQHGEVVLASVFYPIGVSLYSVALVAYPSLLSSATSPRQRAFRAGMIYAVAGWFGSAMGIGMGQHLRQVPVSFAGVATILILGPAVLQFVSRHRRETAAVGSAMLVALGVHLVISPAPSSDRHTLTPEQRGRQVYIAEGCINCHSQYVRPDTADVLMWGPAETIEELHVQRPPLVGNRRQGPDLSQIGGRRSPLWLKAHFFNPGQVSHASFMPSYAYLFRGSTRGDDLVRYLGSLRSPQYAQHVAMEQEWQPSPETFSAASPDEGLHLFREYCTTCHEPTGATRSAWRTQFGRLPPDLEAGPWLHLPASARGPGRLGRLAEIVKFGVPGTDMPGHEYLSDHDVASIALWLNQTMVQPAHFASIQIKPGDHP
jgi:cytochrome c oxidase cbb3-type subunit 2